MCAVCPHKLWVNIQDELFFFVIQGFILRKANKIVALIYKLYNQHYNEIFIAPSSFSMPIS